MLSRAGEMGLNIQNWDGYVGTADYGPQEPGLDILTHLDVVPAGENWKISQPFEPRQVGNRLYGRGAADNKGPTIAVLYALLAVRQCGAALQRRVRLIWGCSEETGAEDIRVYYAAVPPARMTVTPDAAFPVINSEKGRMECRFEKKIPPDCPVRFYPAAGQPMQYRTALKRCWPLIQHRYGSYYLPFKLGNAAWRLDRMDCAA